MQFIDDNDFGGPDAWDPDDDTLTMSDLIYDEFYHPPELIEEWRGQYELLEYELAQLPQIKRKIPYCESINYTKTDIQGIKLDEVEWSEGEFDRLYYLRKIAHDNWTELKWTAREIGAFDDCWYTL